MSAPRPMLERLCGNAALKAGVAAMRQNGRLAHGILLVGEKGLGTGFAARCIAADLLYPAGGPAAEALLRGETCLALPKPDKEGHIETGVVREAVAARGAGAHGEILVDQIRALRTEIFNSGLSVEGRAVLVYGADQMNENAANALLKVLEEPPEGVTFLLTAQSLAGVLPTLRSRSISFAMAPVCTAECVEYCVQQGVAREKAVLYSELFGGRIGTVLATAGDSAAQKHLEDARAVADAAANHDSYTAARLLAGYEKDRPGAAELLRDLIACCAAGLRAPGASPLSGQAAVRTIRCAEAAARALSANASGKAQLTLLAARLGHV